MPRKNKAAELLEFEIRFYEELIRKYPDFVDALIPLAEAFTRRGQHDRGLAIDLRLIELRGQDPIVWYNLGCSYSLLNSVDEAYEALTRSIALGYRDLRHLRTDPDLTNLQSSPNYRRLLDLLSTTRQTV